eukprot:1176386-Prorocentrum_minimum.AAC.4
MTKAAASLTIISCPATEVSPVVEQHENAAEEIALQERVEYSAAFSCWRQPWSCFALLRASSTPEFCAGSPLSVGSSLLSSHQLNPAVAGRD